MIKQLKSHPEHHNAHKTLGLIFNFTKNDEVKTLSIIYEHYRHTYNMHYQHPELEFKMDLKMVIEIDQMGGPIGIPPDPNSIN